MVAGMAMNLLYDLDGTLTDPFEGITRCIFIGRDTRAEWDRYISWSTRRHLRAYQKEWNPDAKRQNWSGCIVGTTYTSISE